MELPKRDLELICSRETLLEFAGKPVSTPLLEKIIPTVLLVQSEFPLTEKPPVGKFGKFCLNTNTSEEAL